MIISLNIEHDQKYFWVESSVLYEFAPSVERASGFQRKKKKYQ